MDKLSCYICGHKGDLMCEVDGEVLCEDCEAISRTHFWLKCKRCQYCVPIGKSEKNFPRIVMLIGSRAPVDVSYETAGDHNVMLNLLITSIKQLRLSIAVLERCPNCTPGFINKFIKRKRKELMAQS